MFPNKIESRFIKRTYLFSWEDVSENNNWRLVESLKQEYDIDWAEVAKTEKIDNDGTIRIFSGENYLILRLNVDKTHVILEIDDGRTDKLDVRIENNKLNIYKYAIRRICQGDILRDIDVIDSYSKDASGALIYDELTLPYIVVMTQDCDLDNDFKNRSQTNPDKHDKYLRTVLVCPAYIAAEFKEGTHLEDLKLKMERYESKRYKQIKEQNNARYHFLDSDLNLQVPELVIDFKHYYAIPRDTLFRMYQDHYLVTLNQLFREFLSQRFSNYLSRIGLPVFKEQKSPNTISIEDV